jgi:hypothetical protein
MYDLDASSYAHAIAVSGGDVYIAGSYHHEPCYWKNGARVDLDSGGMDDIAFAIAVEVR